MKRLKKIKEEKAITLVALVVTIIILLVLAGITLSNLTNTGLFKKANMAANNYKESQIDEQIKLAKLETKQGKRTEAKQHKEEAFEILKKQWEKNTLGKVELGWFSSLASELGHTDIYRQVKASLSSAHSEGLYNNENLTKSI